MDFLNSNNRAFNLETVLKSSPLTPEVQSHLSNVYLTLMATTGFAAAGVYLQAIFSLNFPTLFLILGIGLIIYVGSADQKNRSQRLAALLGFGLLQGLAIGPLVNLAFDIDPMVVFMALLSTTTIFISFSLAAVFAERRSYLFLGGIFSSFFSLMFWMYLFNFFIGSSFPFLVNLYGGLGIFCLYIIYDTQVMIEKAFNGDRDHIRHALDLFLDLVAVFIRILIILLRNSEKKKEKRQSK